MADFGHVPNERPSHAEVPHKARTIEGHLQPFPGPSGPGGHRPVPELPDVEGFRRIVDYYVVGHRIDSFEVLDPGVLRNATALDGARLVTLCVAHAKRDLHTVGPATIS